MSVYKIFTRLGVLPHYILEWAFEQGWKGGIVEDASDYIVLRGKLGAFQDYLNNLPNYKEDRQHINFADHPEEYKMLMAVEESGSHLSNRQHDLELYRRKMSNSAQEIAGFTTHEEQRLPEDPAVQEILWMWQRDRDELRNLKRRN